jgi:hypothetical protein
VLVLLFQATRVYCFVHNVPVCGECICFQEHELCVVSELPWLILWSWLHVRKQIASRP